MKAHIKSLQQILQDPVTVPKEWDLKLVQNDDNLTYLALNHSTREAIWVDPVLEDFEIHVEESKTHSTYRFLAVIDTHTHADHLSNAGQLANHLGVPLIMHAHAPTKNAHLRVARDTKISTAAGDLRLLVTPGHTWDSITPIWGPFVFTGDTILYGDTGRDDLPTGDATQHYESLEKIREAVQKDFIMLPGHDAEGRASSWGHQLNVNPSLTQAREDFIREASAFSGRPPKLLKESLFYNFK